MLNNIEKKNTKVEVVISFDTTSSMYVCLTQVRRNVEETVRKLHKDISGIKIGIIAHGDYCDNPVLGGNSYVIKSLDLTDDVNKICGFVKTVGITDGGDLEECYELALNEARQMSWTRGSSKVVVLIGDNIPHSVNYPLNVKKLDWRNELGLLIEAGVSVYAVQALGGTYPQATPFYQEVAKTTGGFHLSLDQFSHVRDTILAICYRQAGNENLKKFEKEVQSAGRMNRSLDATFAAMLGRAPSSSFKTRALDAVDPGMFQVLKVDRDVSIKEFVEENGLNFAPGKGFYEFTKPEDIQSYKEVILQEVTSGDMFSGTRARQMLGLPNTDAKRFSPRNIGPYRAFVQSSSYNRKLKAGTHFLYEVDAITASI